MTAPSDTKAAARALLDLNRAAPRAARAFAPPTVPAPSSARLSDEQESILSCHSDRLVITALAGTGKSRVLGEFARREPQRKWHYLAFNKSMAKEASSSMRGVVAKTVHSLAYAVFGAPYEGQLGLVANDECVLRVCGAPAIGEKSLATIIRGTVDRFIASEDVEIGKSHVPMAAWREWAASGRDVASADEVVAFAHAWWSSMVQRDGAAPMGLDGLVKLMQLSGHVPLVQKDSAFLVDEAQDLTPCVRSWLDALPYRVVRAGDPFQSIYGWRMHGMAREWLGPRDQEMWLTGSWRFGQEVADLVNPLLSYLGAGNGLRGLAGNTDITTVALGTEAMLSRKRSTLRAAIVEAWKRGYSVNPAWSPWLSGPQEDAEVLTASDETLQSSKGGFSSDGLMVMTAHASKGGSFDAVRLLSDFSWPPPDQTMDAMEEARVLYVALTRARKRLVIEEPLLAALKAIPTRTAQNISDDGF